MKPGTTKRIQLDSRDCDEDEDPWLGKSAADEGDCSDRE